MSFYDGLAAEKYDRQYSDRQLLRRMVRYFIPLKKQFIIISVMVMLMAVFGAGIPLAVARGVDLLKTSSGKYGIFLISFAVLLIGVLNWLVNLIRRRLTVRTIADVLVNLSTDAFASAAEHDLSFYDQFSSGRILSRITSDTREFGNLIVLVTDLVSQVTEAVILGIILVRINLTLSWILFAMVPLIFVMAISFRRLARSVTRDGMRAMATVNAAIKETVSGIAVAKNFRQEASIFKQFDQANKTSYRVNIKRGLILTLVFPTLHAISGIVIAVLVYVGGLTVIQGLVTAGAWYLFIMSQDRFMFPVMNLSSFWTQVQSGLSAAERVFALIDADPAVVQENNLPVPQLRGEIEFERVNFSYNTGEEVLVDFNLCISPGETIAFVGHTGGGKSSIAKLIARFYEFQQGKIYIDGHDIRTFDLKSYRRQLGMVSQVPFLFSESVADNIRYGRPEVSDTEILNMARRIGDGEWMKTLPEGLNTQVGERGTLLSMGQRQLVALMRVLVQRPTIFILDEATASIDPFTEWQIQQALNLIMAQSTSIIIAHRLSTVKQADRIIVIDQGKIIEEGNHVSLLQKGGYYSTLYNTYFRHQSLEYIEQSRAFADLAR